MSDTEQTPAETQPELQPGPRAEGSGPQLGVDVAFQQLADPSFRRLFLAKLISAFGSSMAPVAIVFGVLELTERPALAGLVVAAQTLTQAAVQLFAGAVADRWDRRKVIVLADLLAASAQIVVAVMFFRGIANIPLLLGLTACMGVAYSLYWPAAAGLIPQVVHRDKLQPANAVIALARATALGLGAATAGVLVAAFGAGWAIAIDAGTFLASAVLISGVRPRTQQKPEGNNLLRDLVDGWKEFRSRRWVWALTLQFTVLLMGWHAGFIIAGPVVARDQLGGAAAWGLIAGAYGVGSLLGAFVAMRFHIERPLFVGTLLMFSFAVPLLLLSVPSTTLFIAAGALVAGICIEIFAVVWFTAMQTLIPPQALSRVLAYDTLGSIALAPLGEAAAGPLIEMYGTRPTLWIAATLVVVPTALVLLVPEVRNLTMSGGGGATSDQGAAESG